MDNSYNELRLVIAIYDPEVKNIALPDIKRLLTFNSLWRLYEGAKITISDASDASDAAKTF